MKPSCRIYPPTRLGGALLVAALLSSCSFLEPVPDPSRFYVLTTVDDSDPSMPALGSVSLGVGPIRLPDYVRRQEIVRRTGATEVRPSTFDRWAGDLDNSVSRVLSEDLSRALGTDRISTYPSFEISRADYLVEVTVVRFDLDTQNTAFLNARWQVRDNRTKGRNLSRETQAVQPAASPDTGAGVEALSRTLGDLSRDIAAAVRELNRM